MVVWGRGEGGRGRGEGGRERGGATGEEEEREEGVEGDKGRLTGCGGLSSGTVELGEEGRG